MNHTTTRPVLDSAMLRAEFDRRAGGLRTITNKLTGETYAGAGDTLAVATTTFCRPQAAMRQVAWSATAISRLKSLMNAVR